MLIILSGLPGVGKTAIARELAAAIGAIHIRIDSIEQALRNAGRDVEAEGYAVGHAVAADNLRLGRTVIADSVNPWPVTRDEWRAVAERLGVGSVDVEIVCSDEIVHKHRVESRTPDLSGHRLPTWNDVLGRDYRPWDRERIVIDTGKLNIEESVHAILAAIQPQG
jgi:predicted kinase